MDKNLISYIKGYQLIESTTCKQIIDEIENIDWQQHVFYAPGNDVGEAWSGNKELDVGYSQSPSKSLVMEKIWQAFYNYVMELNFPWFSSWQGYTEVRFNRYKETRLMAEHCDHIHALFDGQRKGIPTMTALGCLNDDYQGGEIVFFRDLVVPFRAGEIKIFPSCFLFPHRVNPVTQGTRYSFVSWAW
jgi:predicted 2-oxoglutarate/Fe(II)-dependent dioxygenase YbiX